MSYYPYRNDGKIFIWLKARLYYAKFVRYYKACFDIKTSLHVSWFSLLSLNAWFTLKVQNELFTNVAKGVFLQIPNTNSTPFHWFSTKKLVDFISRQGRILSVAIEVNYVWLYYFVFVVSESFHMLEDGHYTFEVEGLCETDPDAYLYPTAKPPSRVSFSTGPIKVCVARAFQTEHKAIRNQSHQAKGNSM